MAINRSVITISVKLEVATRRDGEAWLAWCLPIDVMTQADTKKDAISSLKQAVELWFESCIDRDVLDQALIEAGFKKTRLGENAPKTASIVKVHQPKPSSRHPFSTKRDYIEVSIPAYVAAQYNEGLCAPR